MPHIFSNRCSPDLELSQPVKGSTQGYYDCQISRCTIIPKPSRLLGLPVEIREQIYSFIFHTRPESRASCLKFRYQLENSGCQCGHGLSLTNQQLYNETRSLFYEVGDFSFDSPVTCKRFLQSIRHYRDHLSSLEISYEDTFSQTSVLREIFAMFKTDSKIHTLRLQTAPYSLSLVPESPPIYFPSFQRAFPAEFYDLSYRPIRHPLAEMISIRSLTVVGHPGSGNIDEALLKLRVKLEEIAAQEHKSKEWTEAWHVGSSDWRYTLEISDVVSSS